MIRLTDYKTLGCLVNRVYKITNPSGNSYVGKFTDINRLHHYANVDNSVRDQPALYNSLKKYGADYHTIEILTGEQKCEHLKKYEMAFIRYYDTFNTGLNCTLGGDGVTKYTDQFCTELTKLHEEGLNLTELGNRYNLQATSISRLIKRTGTRVIRRYNTGKRKPIPTEAMDENNVLRKVVPKSFFDYKKSPWHLACRRLRYRMLQDKQHV